MNSINNSKQVAWIAIGQFFSYGVGIVSPMILSRYFDKADYGTYKQIMFIYGTLLTVFSFGLPRAYSYFIPRVSLGESRDVVKKISNIFFIIGCSFSLLLLFGSHHFSILLKNRDLELALKLFSPTPLFLLPVMGLDCILASYNKSKLIALYTISTKLFTLVCIVLPVVLFRGNYIHAIIGFDIASFLTFILASYLKKIPIKNIDYVRTSVTYKDIYSFTSPLVLASIWIVIFQSSNQFFISRYYGNETFAEFSNGFMEFPIIPMVISSVSTVLLPLFSRMVVNNKEQIASVWINALTKSLKITYPMIVFCMFFADLIMRCFFGDQYASSGQYFVIKSIEGLFTIIPFYPILLALGKTKEYSYVHLIMAFIVVLLDFIVVKLDMPAVTLAIVYVLCSLFKIIMQFVIVGRTIDIKMLEFIPLRSMIKTFGIACLSALVPYLLKNYFLIDLNPFIFIIVLCVVFVICYYCFCWLLKLSYKDIAERYLTGVNAIKLLKFVP